MMSNNMLIGYFIFLHFLLGLILMKSDFVEIVSYKLGAPKPELSSHYHNMVAYQKRMDSQIPDDAVIFIGDSSTQSLLVSNITPMGVNYGIGSDTTLGVLKRLPLYTSLNRSRLIVLDIGINDLKIRQNDEILANYQLILEHLPDDVSVIICALQPVDERLWNFTGVNTRIRSINNELNNLAKNNKQWDFCDAGNQLAGEDGNLKPEFHTGDGVHFNATGYEIWSHALREVVVSSSLDR